MTKIFNSPWGKLAVAVILIASIFFILRFLGVNFYEITMQDFKNKINSLGIWGPITYIILYILRPLIFFPAALLSASAGVIWGLKGFLILQIAANISSSAEFFIARYFARKAVERLMKNKLQNIDKSIEKHGFLTVLLIRLIPNVAWDIQNLGLGITKVKTRDYLLATFIGIMPGSFALVYFGTSLINVSINPKNFWMIIIAIIIFVVVYMLQRYLKEKQDGKIN